MQEAEDGIAVNESGPYSQLIEFQSGNDVDVPPSSSSKLSYDAEAEGTDDFVQENPLAEPHVDGTDLTMLETVDSPTTEPEALTTPYYQAPAFEDYTQTVPPEEKETVRDDAKVNETKAESGSGPLAATVHTQYSGRYIGSVRLPEGDLIGDKSTATMTECITTVAKGSKKTNKVIHEFKENQKVILKLEEREFKLTTDEKNAKVILCHPLRKIRVWAVGKEPDSRHFAYVIRTPDESAGYSYVCRVFKCNIKARDIATALRNVCQRRAAMRADKNS